METTKQGEIMYSVQSTCGFYMPDTSKPTKLTCVTLGKLFKCRNSSNGTGNCARCVHSKINEKIPKINTGAEIEALDLREEIHQVGEISYHKAREFALITVRKIITSLRMAYAEDFVIDYWKEVERQIGKL